MDHAAMVGRDVEHQTHTARVERLAQRDQRLVAAQCGSTAVKSAMS